MKISVDTIVLELAAPTGITAAIDPKAAATVAREAAILVGDYIGESAVPQEIAELATTEVARELYTRQQAPGGVFTQFGEAGPVRLARSPMKSAHAILAPYLEGSFA